MIAYISDDYYMAKVASNNERIKELEAIIAQMNNERSASYVDNQAEDKLEMALLIADQAKRNLANDPGNTSLLDMAERAVLTYNQMAKRMGRKSYEELRAAPEVPADPAKPKPKSKAEIANDYMAAVTQAADKGDYKALKALEAELNDDAHKNETQYNDARTAVNKAIVDIEKKNAAKRKRVEARRKAEAELKSILDETHDYGVWEKVIARAAELAKILGKQTTYAYDHRNGRVKEYK